MAPDYGDQSATDRNLSPQEQELTEAEVERVAQQAWTDSATGGKLPPKPRPLTYGPKKSPVRDKKSKVKRKRPSEMLRSNEQEVESESSSTRSVSRGSDRAARRAARAYTQNVQQALHPINRASSDYNSIEHMGTTLGDPTAAVLAGTPPTLDFDPYSEEELAQRLEGAYVGSDDDSFTSVSVELKHQPHLNVREIAAATAAAAAEALQQEQGQRQITGSLSAEQRRRALEATIEEAASEVEAANATIDESNSVFAQEADAAEGLSNAAAAADEDAAATAEALTGRDEDTFSAEQAQAQEEAQAQAQADAEQVAAIMAEAEAGIGLNELGLPADDRIGLVGQMTFPDIRQYDLVYVNKLKTIATLLNFGQVLLVRPHGFGVTFLLSLLECILGGYRQFIAGLEDAEEVKNIMVHPVSVVRLDLGQFVIKLSYDAPALKAYEEFKAAELETESEHVASEAELELQDRFAQNEEQLDASRTRLWRLRNGYQEIHNRLDELNRICAMQQGVLMRSFAAKDASEWTMHDLDVPAENGRANTPADTDTSTTTSTAAASAREGTGAQDEEELEVTAELSVPPLEEAFPLLAMDDEDVVIPAAARSLVDALSLCEESLRLLQWQQQCLGLQIDLYLAKEHWLRCQMQLDLANEEDDRRKEQMREVLQEMQQEGEDPDYVGRMLSQMEDSPEVKKARDRTALAHMRVVAVSSHLEAIREINDSSDLLPLKQLQALINTLRQREAAAASSGLAPKIDAIKKQVPDSVRPLMEEVALMSRLLRELQREWSKKRAAYGRLQRQQNEILTALKRLLHEQEQEQAQNAPSEQEMLEMLGQKQFLWEQERDRLINELATAYYQQFYLALAQPTQPYQSEIVAAAYAKHSDAEGAAPEEADAESGAGAGADAESAADAAATAGAEAGAPANVALTPEQESEIVANTEVTLMNFEGLLTALIKEHASRIQPCALLLDNYDAALTSVGDCPELLPPLQKLVEKMVNALRLNQELFAHIFFMGSTDFASNRVFFGFGRLVDISQLNNDLGNIVGFTEDELINYFGSELDAAVLRIEAQRRIVLHDEDYEYSLEELLSEMQEHYGNYTFAPHASTTLFKTKEVLQFLQDRSEQYLFKEYE